jgi:hypothetical protein
VTGRPGAQGVVNQLFLGDVLGQGGLAGHL